MFEYRNRLQSDSNEIDNSEMIMSSAGESNINSRRNIRNPIMPIDDMVFKN